MPTRGSSSVSYHLISLWWLSWKVLLLCNKAKKRVCSRCNIREKLWMIVRTNKTSSPLVVVLLWSSHQEVNKKPPENEWRRDLKILKWFWENKASKFLLYLTSSGVSIKLIKMRRQNKMSSSTLFFILMVRSFFCKYVIKEVIS